MLASWWRLISLIKGGDMVNAGKRRRRNRTGDGWAFQAALPYKTAAFLLMPLGWHQTAAGSIKLGPGRWKTHHQLKRKKE